MTIKRIFVALGVGVALLLCWVVFTPSGNAYSYIWFKDLSGFKNGLSYRLEDGVVAKGHAKYHLNKPFDDMGKNVTTFSGTREGLFWRMTPYHSADEK